MKHKARPATVDPFALRDEGRPPKRESGPFAAPHVRTDPPPLPLPVPQPSSSAPPHAPFEAPAPKFEPTAAGPLQPPPALRPRGGRGGHAHASRPSAPLPAPALERRAPLGALPPLPRRATSLRQTTPPVAAAPIVHPPVTPPRASSRLPARSGGHAEQEPAHATSAITFEVLVERGIEAVLARDLPHALRLLSAAHALRPDDRLVTTNLERLRALGVKA